MQVTAPSSGTHGQHWTDSMGQKETMELGQEEILEDLKGVGNLCTCMKLSKETF